MTDLPAGTATGTSIDTLVAIKSDYVNQTLDWHTSRTLWPRLVFRAVGTLVNVVSLGIPFLVVFKDHFWTWVLPAASFMIAALTALNTFFGWQKLWEKRIDIQLTLEGLVALWQTEIAAARRGADPATGFERALKGLRNLSRRLRR